MTENNTESTTSQDNVTKKENQTALAENGAIFCPAELAETRSNEDNGKTEQKLTEILQSMNSETLQLNQAITEEGRIIEDVCLSLKEVTTKLGVSFNVPPQDVPTNKGTKKAILDEQCRLTFTYGNEEKQTAFLAEYPPQTVMVVLWEVIPELAKAVSIYRKRMNARASFFTKVKQELKAAAKSITSTSATRLKPLEKPTESNEKEQIKT
jgi:hypothetical protein